MSRRRISVKTSGGGGGGGGGGPNQGGDTVRLGPDYGEGVDVTAGTAVALDLLTIAPNVDVGTAVALDLLTISPGVDAGVAAALQQLALGPFDLSVGASVAGTLTVNDQVADTETSLDESAPDTPQALANSYQSRLPDALGDNEAHAYLAWDLTDYAGTTITSATFRFTTETENSVAENADVEFYTSPSQPWVESTATWNNTEPPSGTLRQTTSVSFPVTAAEQTVVAGSTLRANMDGNWVFLRFFGAAALGLFDTLVYGRVNADSLQPTLDLVVSL